MGEQNEKNLFATIKQHICTCSGNLMLSPDIEEVSKIPKRELHVSGHCLVLRDGPELEP